MEEFIIRNYIYHNLRDLLFRINKLQPDFLTDECLAHELECLKEYVRTLKLTNTPEPVEPLSEVNTEPQIKTTSKVKRSTRKPKAESNVSLTPIVLQWSYNPVSTTVTNTKPLFTFDMTQFQMGQTHVSSDVNHPTVQEQTVPVSVVASKKAPSSDKITSCQCIARVVLTSGKGISSSDYISYPNNPTMPIYGRQCKNVRQNEETQFCRVHNIKCDYGIFTDNPSEDVKTICLRKYTRLKEIEDRHCQEPI